MNNKGQFGNILLISVILLILGLTIPISYMIVKQFTANSGVLITNPTAQAILTAGGNSFGVWDYGFVFLMVGTIFGLIVSATQIRTSPVFFAVFLFMLALEFFLVPIFSNVADEFFKTDAINSSVVVATSFPIMNSILLNLPFIMAFALIIFLVVLFGKPSEDNNVY
jgi:hypothetical protein